MKIYLFTKALCTLSTFILLHATLLFAQTPACVYQIRGILTDSLMHSFSARISNPFPEYRNNIKRTFGPDFNQVNTISNYFRSFSLSLNYNLGSLKDGLTKSRKSIENNDLSN